MDVGSRDEGQFWSSFDRDPRVPENQSLRASDRDRDLVREVISEAYADGRLTQEEMDARLTQVQETRLLGDVLSIVGDLIPTWDTGSRKSLVHANQAEIDRLALVRYKERRGQALIGMLVPSLICLTIWIWSMINTGGMVFPWPVFVILGTGGYLWRMLLGRESAIEEERERIRKKQAKALAIEADRSRPAGGDHDDHPSLEERRRDWR
jgi:Domain of unknown function (DUF1707)